jgi:hypothetical protein
VGKQADFDTWTKRLRNDCAARGKIREFDGLGPRILRILYENGLDPTVEAIVKDGMNGKANQRPGDRPTASK